MKIYKFIKVISVKPLLRLGKGDKVAELGRRPRHSSEGRPGQVLCLANLRPRTAVVARVQPVYSAHLVDLLVSRILQA